MITLYLVRHGQKEAIPFDPGLTEIGVKQAEVTAEHLRKIPFNEIVASPKLRTRQTAEILAKPHGLPIRTDERLIERLEWESGQTFDAFIDEWNKTDFDRSYTPKMGKSSQQNGQDIKGLLDELARKYTDAGILVVAHGGSIGDLLRTLFTEEAIEHKTDKYSGAKYIDIAECSVTEIQKETDNYKLIKLGDISHLSIPLK